MNNIKSYLSAYLIFTNRQSKETWEDKLGKSKKPMAFMKDYVIVHFNDEEIYQEQIGYPDIETHKSTFEF